MGVVFAFFSNQQVFNSVNEFEETTSDTFDLAENFVNDSILVTYSNNLHYIIKFIILANWDAIVWT